MLRTTLVLAVVVYHVRIGAVQAGEPVPRWVDEMVRGIEPVRMPVLMMLSGWFLPRSLAKGTRRYVIGKSSALVAPYVGWFLLFYFVLLADEHRPTDRWWIELVVPQTPLWFLCYLAAYFAVALPLRTPALRVVGLAAALAWLQLVGDSDWHVVFYFACFLLGAVLSDRDWSRVPRSWEVAATVAAVGPAAWAVHTAVVRDHTERTVAWIALATCALLVGRGLATLVARTAPGRWLASFGPLTIVMFLAHTALLAAWPAPAGSWWASLALTMVVTLAAAEVVRRDERWWLPFDVRRGWRAWRSPQVPSAQASAQAGAHVQADLGVDDDLLRGDQAVDHELGVDRRVPLEER